MLARRNAPLIHLLFFLSGAAGLVYQVVWSRLLNEIFGVTAHAVTAVLATYLGGLALGAWVLGRAADRCARPLRLYAWLEIGVGATALAGTWLARVLDPIHVWAASRLAPDSAALLGVRCLLASAVIVPPTFLMGGTLPAITRAFVDRLGRLGRELSLVYAVNTSGAVVGSLAAGFALIRALGVHPTLWLAVAVNVAVGALALALGGRETAVVPDSPKTAVSQLPAAAPGRAWLLVVMALSGAASLSLEVIWTRMLVLVVGTSTYAFVTMLSAFLVGIALGSFLARPFVDRLVNPRRTFGWIQVAIAASTLATIPLTGAVMLSAQRWFDAMELRWLGLTLGRFGMSFLVMLVPTTLIGTTFPLAARIWTRGMGTLGGQLGQLYGANTLGNIVGAFAGGFVLLPAFGMQKGIALLTTLNLASAAWGLLPASEDRRRTAVWLRAAPISAGVWCCVLLLALWHPRPLAASGGSDADPVRYYREGLVSTVKVVQRAQDGRQLLMLVDGITIGQSSTGVDKKQQVLAHLPFLLKADRPPARVLSIGLGTGILVGEVAKHPGVESVECVELSPSVIEGARLFAAYNGNVLDNPRVRVVNDDGVNFLRRSAARYDAVISDGKSRSGHAGNALFYSQDYYRIAREHLAAGGLMVQWVPLDMPSDDVRTIFRTFLSVFPHAYAWLGDGSCFVVGSDEPLVLDLAHVQRALDAPETADLRRHGWRDATEVASLLLADRPSLEAWVSREGSINSLEKPVLEFYSPGALTAPDSVRVADNLAALAQYRGTSELGLVRADPASLAARSRAVDRLVRGLSLLGRGDGKGIAWAERAAADAPESGVIRRLAGEAIFNVALDLDRSGDVEHAIGLYYEVLHAWPEFPEAEVNLARDLGIRGQVDEAIVHLRRALQVNPEYGSAHRLLGESLLAMGNPVAAIGHLRRASEIAPALPETHGNLGVSLAMVGLIDDAIPELGEELRLNPRGSVATARLALLLASHPDPSRRDALEALRLARRATDLVDPQDPATLEIIAASFAALGRFDDAVAIQRRALGVTSGSGDPTLVSQAKQALELYEHGMALPQDLPVITTRPAAL